MLIERQTIRNYYEVATGLIQQANSDMLFIIHDAFASLYYWTSYSSPANPNCVLDTHHYEGMGWIDCLLTVVFGSTFDLGGQINDVCSFGSELANVEPSILTVVGEFSGAQTDCKYLWDLSHCRYEISEWLRDWRALRWDIGWQCNLPQWTFLF